jgi:hypothetical protein
LSANLLLCGIQRNKAPHPDQRHTCHTCKPWSFFGREVKKGGSKVDWISLTSVGCKGSRATKYLLMAILVFQTKSGWGDLGFSNFLNHIPHKKKCEMKITEPKCRVLLDPEGGTKIAWST